MANTTYDLTGVTLTMHYEDAWFDNRSVVIAIPLQLANELDKIGFTLLALNQQQLYQRILDQVFTAWYKPAFEQALDAMKL